MDDYIHTVNGERFAGLNFHIFCSFQEYRKSFSMDIWLFILYKFHIMGVLSVNISHRKIFPMKTSLGGIHESLAQRIFPHLQYSCNTQTPFVAM